MLHIEVKRIWDRRALVYFDKGNVSFQIGFKVHPENNYLYLLPQTGVNLSRAVLDEIRRQIWIKIGENENAENSKVLQ